MAIAIATPTARAAEPDTLAPGTATMLVGDGLSAPALVYLPDDYRPDRLWPAVFHYHGSGGRPEVDIPRAYTRGKGFVIVGMAYVTQSLPKTTRDYLELELAHLRNTRDILSARLAIDPARLVVGGFSKGGWFASEFAEVNMREFAGVYILGAGKNHRRTRRPNPFPPTKPVFVATGHSDPNFIYSVRAIPFFRGLGADVTFDEFLGYGHTIGTKPDGSPPISTALQQWFLRLASPQHDTLAPQAAAWSAASTKRLENLSDPTEKFILLERLKRKPFFDLLPEPDKDRFDTHFDQLANTPELADEMRVRQQYLNAIERESAAESWDHYRTMAAHYADIYTAAPDSHHGRRAALEAARLDSLLSVTQRWRFADPEEKQRKLAAASKNPLPNIPQDTIKAHFRDLHRRVE